MSGLRIALVYDAIFPYVKGGGERRFYEIARQLAGNGYDVHLYGMQFWDGPAIVRRDNVTLHGLCKARPLYTPDGRRSITQALIFGVSCFKLLGARFDVMDCCGFPYFSMLPCRIVTWLKHKPLHATWHEVWGRTYWQTYLGKLGPVGYLVELLASRLPDVIIAVSDQTAADLRATLHVKRPVYVVENGIHLADIARLEAGQLRSDVMYAGRLMNFKNVDLLIRAIALLSERSIAAYCAIIGDGPERQQLERLAEKLGVGQQIRFTGFVTDHQDVIRHMKSSKVFVLPSTREGFGMVVVEANAAGLPVITVDHPNNAARALVTGKNGTVTKPQIADLAAAIAEALDGKFNPADCAAAAQAYDWRHLTRKLEKVLA